VADVISWAMGTGNHDSHIIVFKQNNGLELQEAKLGEDGSEVFHNLSSANVSHKFTLSGADKDGCYPFGPVSNISSSQAEEVCNERTMGADAFIMRGIQVSTHLIDCTRGRHHTIKLVHRVQVR
jgi:hypothetical protein